jgi:hypothetical protein
MNQPSCFEEDVLEIDQNEKHKNVFGPENRSSAFPESASEPNFPGSSLVKMSENWNLKNSGSHLIVNTYCESNTTEDTTLQMSENLIDPDDISSSIDESRIRSVSVTDSLQEAREIEFVLQNNAEGEERWKTYLRRIGAPKCPVCGLVDSEWGPVQNHVLDFHGVMEKYDPEVITALIT